jgi:hypothetical protein
VTAFLYSKHAFFAAAHCLEREMEAARRELAEA